MQATRGLCGKVAYWRNIGLLNNGHGNVGFLNNGNGNFGVLNHGSRNFGLLCNGDGNSGVLVRGCSNRGAFINGSGSTGAFLRGDGLVGFLRGAQKGGHGLGWKGRYGGKYHHLARRRHPKRLAKRFAAALILVFIVFYLLR